MRSLVWQLMPAKNGFSSSSSVSSSHQDRRRHTAHSHHLPQKGRLDSTEHRRAVRRKPSTYPSDLEETRRQFDYVVSAQPLLTQLASMHCFFPQLAHRAMECLPATTGDDIGPRLETKAFLAWRSRQDTHLQPLHGQPVSDAPFRPFAGPH